VAVTRPAGTVIHVHPPRHVGPAVARHPDDRAFDAGVQVATLLVLGEEGVQLGQQLTAVSVP
jgi:hypothetical protein